MRKHLPDLFDEQPDLLHKLVSKSYCIVLYGCFMFGIRLGVPCSVVVWTSACNSFFFFFFSIVLSACLYILHLKAICSSWDLLFGLICL